jgi:hypothetical protein
MVLPPPCRGSNTAHLHTAGKEARCPRTTTRGLKHRNSLEKERTQDSPEPEVPLCPLSAIYQLPLHTLQQCGTPIKNLCIHALDRTVHLCARSLMHGY